MPNVRLCAVCQGHNARNYKLYLHFNVPEVQHKTGVNAATLDLCDPCWTRLTNKRSLTMEGVLRRVEQRRENILARRATD